MNKNKLSYVSLLLSVLLLSSIIYSQDLHYKVTGNITIGGGNRWDYAAIDKPLHRLFITHASEVNVIDLNKDSVIGTIANLNGVHGTAFADEFGKGFISEGKSNTVTVFDLNTLKVMDQIKLDAIGPDAIIYDPFSKRIFTFNGRSSNATAIDAKTNKVLGNIQLSGGPEFAVSDYNGKIFVNIEDKSSIEVFDASTLKVLAQWPIAPGEKPSGLAMDREHKILFSGCHNKLLVVVNAESGKVITTLPIGLGIDACVYDPSSNMAFSSNGEGTITVVKETSADKFAVIDNVKTEKGARTMALDEASHKIFTPTMLDGKKFGVLILEQK